MAYLAAGDADALAALHARCFAKSWDAQDFRRFSGWPPYFGLTAWQDTTPIGFILASTAAAQSDILIFGVDPAFRRRGIASALLAQLLAEAGGLGIESLFLEVEAGNAAALSLYRRHGFDISGRRPAYYDTPEGPQDALVMTLHLPSTGSHARPIGSAAIL